MLLDCLKPSLLPQRPRQIEGDDPNSSRWSMGSNGISGLVWDNRGERRSHFTPGTERGGLPWNMKGGERSDSGSGCVHHLLGKR